MRDVPTKFKKLKSNGDVLPLRIMVVTHYRWGPAKSLTNLSVINCHPMATLSIADLYMEAKISSAAKLQMLYRTDQELSPTKPHLTPSKKLTSSKDTIVQILITSKISNTKPLIVRRKMHQPLKDVRLAWLNRQDLPKGLESSIFLTWKGKRLFDVTTCRSLGIGPKCRHAHGPVACDSLRSDSSDLQIHMEAATDNPLDPDNSRSLSSAKLAPGVNLDSGELSLKNIVLKAPGLDDLRLRVSLQMQVSQLIRLFRDARQISLEHEVYLVFDGERLDLGCALEDYDLANDDLLDVIVK
ncbi:small ubiquitin-related modifier domain-containing protein [Aspergillus brunneoviolaceus CBS 621.78]|uniref:Uncharacterized protein n=1 Tax=Aspergillus brunneoviolaceus CBS 621.78 TaxID=1450534 RepID=A0ACD1GB34_9EURO|nr:hypothetical protein BO95DRAFT_513877 [Aspergillus brunneoviolaceus CBS 621.78]RAH46427.1 hypothetical protein BO95DRAFT_513877 [Aspergillus brunneoviolaceus CBS 621.78]